MRFFPAGIALGLALLPSLLASQNAVAQARESQVVVKVGDAAITVGEVERRLEVLAPHQLSALGKSPSEVRRNFVERVLVPELLLASEARRRKLPDEPATRQQIQGALRVARLKALRDEIANRGINREEILQYYAANKERFESPERIQVWRILCKTEEEARKVLAEAKKAGTPEKWDELARAHSIDQATAMRRGNLGFLAPDGTSQFQGVKVPEAIVAAAAKLKDGEIAPEPVRENDGYAVIWRRGSTPAVQRSLDDEIEAISQVLWRQKAEEARKALVTELREKHLREYNPQLVSIIAIDTEARLGLQKRPGQAERPAKGKPAPSGSPGQMR